MRRIISLVVMFALSVFGIELSFGQSTNDVLTLSVELAKNSYRLNDRMIIGFTITNKSDNPVLIMRGKSFSKPYCFDLIFKDEEGNILPSKKFAFEENTPPYTIIIPTKQSFTFRYELEKWTVRDKPFGEVEGDYTIIATYEPELKYLQLPKGHPELSKGILEKMDYKDAWRGKLQSPPLNVSIRGQKTPLMAKIKADYRKEESLPPYDPVHPRYTNILLNASLILTNIGREDVAIVKSKELCKVILKDSQGSIIEPEGIGKGSGLSPIKLESFKILAPMQSEEIEVIKETEFWDTPFDPARISRRCTFRKLPPGDYFLAIVYENSTHIKDMDNIWTGEISTEPILIKIEKFNKISNALIVDFNC